MKNPFVKCQYRRKGSSGLPLLATLILTAFLTGNVRAQDESSVQLGVSFQDRLAATISISGAHYHLFLASNEAAKGISRDLPPLAPYKPRILHAALATVPSPPPPAFYPEDVSKIVSTAKTVTAAQSHAVFLNCASTCWGNPTGFLSNLGNSNFIHLLDQYVGTTALGRYTVGTSVSVTATIFAGTSGVPTLGENDILAIVHAAAKAVVGTGYGHIYHVFLPKGVDTCFDEGPCYSPDNPATNVFCGYHSSVTFSDIGHVLYSVEPFQNVSGCQVPASPTPPNGQLADSTDTTLSHELFETVSDPDGNAFRALNSAPVFGLEIGDLCGGLLAILALNGHNYEVQLEYSDFYHACASTP